VVCNKKVVESLIKAGAFDSLGHARRGLLAVHADVIDAAMGTKRAEAVGQFDLFGSMDDETSGPGLGFDVVIPSAEWDKTTLLAAERDMLGLYVSDHPLFGVEHVLSRLVDCPVASLTADERPEGSIVTIGGIVSSLQRKMTKQGSPWAIATVEDLEGAIEVLFFPQTYQQYAMQLAEDAVICVKGRLNKRDDVPSLAAIEMFMPDLGEALDRGPVVLQIPAARCTPPVVERLREVLKTHPGVTEVQLQLRNGTRTTVLRLDENLRVEATPALMGDLKALLGPSCLVG
ncbi:MAG TPA: OB-fold nucleic acid binding domain-containing protein, partial [Acidothermaceae bacterium]|nr:OB-fold nucleic acid binding domain-containing protein [Acidothermaceae bacterium]